MTTQEITQKTTQETSQESSQETTAGFIHLRAHTSYSMLEGTLRAPDLVSYCERHASPAIAITDSHGLFGIPEMSAALAQASIKPLLGLEAHLHFETHDTRTTSRPRLAPLVFLAMTTQGYNNLMRLASALYHADLIPNDNNTKSPETHADKILHDKALHDLPHLTFEHLERYHEGILVLSGGLEGPLGILLGEERFDEAHTLCRRMSKLFVDRFYIELNRFADKSNAPARIREQRIEKGLLSLCTQENLPPVATNNCMFENPAMHEAQDVLLAIAQGVPVSNGSRRRSSPRQDLASPASMRALFQDLPEACENTLHIAERCSVLFEPRATILPRFAEGEEDEAALLRKQAHEGLEHLFGGRLALPPHDSGRVVYEERLEVELEVIIEKGLQGYFLIVADFIRWAKEQEIPVGPGRGSGAGSLVAWALAITALDPVRWGLLFERFLNPERMSMPDFDIDFCQERREQVIAYVRQRYGEEKVGQIITLGTLQARAAVRDVGRALGISYPRVDRLCKTLPAFQSLKDSLQDSLKDKSNALAREAEDPSIAKLLDLAQKLEGLNRHASTHAAGIVIGDRALAELVPLYRDKETGFNSTQFTMKYVEQAGLIKFDFLGLKTLSVMAHCQKLLRERGTELDMEGLSLDSSKVFQLFSRADTFGVFQFESAGIREVLRRMRPDRFEDIVAAVALYRPGPMEHIPSYVARKHGREPIGYLHEKLEPILRETYGIPVYQEQVIRMAQVLAGFSLGASDRLRRAMGKKDSLEMHAQRKSFFEGCAKSGMEQRVASKIFEQIYAFAGYGFNKSHAAAYAMIAYQTAWLRVHHPAAFFVSMMVFDAENTDRLAQYVPCLQGLDIALLPPDVNRSCVEFALEQVEGKDAIRYGLGALKHVGAKAMEEVVDERRRGGNFRDLFDFAERMAGQTLARRSLESLVRSGAFDTLNENRAQSFEAIDLLLYVMQSKEEEGQESMFGSSSQQEAAQQGFAPRKLPQAAAWDTTRRMREEREAVGFYLSGHPLAEHRALCEGAGFLTASDLEGVGDGERIRIAGRLEEVIEKKLKDSSKRLVVLSLSDPSGSFEATLFSTQAAKYASLREEGALIVLELDCVRMPNRDRMQFRVVKLKPFDEPLRRRLQGQASMPSSAPASIPAPVSAPEPAFAPMPAPVSAPMSSSSVDVGRDMSEGSEGYDGGRVERLLLHVRGVGGGWDPGLLANFLAASAECMEHGGGEIELCIREESRILRVLLGQHYRLDAALEHALGELGGVERVERRRAA